MSEHTSVHTQSDSGVPAEARDFSVRDRVVIVTGAAQGIGREFARQFAAAGAAVAVADLNAEAAEAVVSEIEHADGRALAVTVDIANKSSTDAMAATVLSHFGRIDVLINNAAIFATLEKKPFEQIGVEEWEKVMKVNVTGSFLCVCAVAPAMRKTKWGRIVNISSAAVPRGAPNYLHYVASKSAVIGMTNGMARELGRDGITVNCIRPGGVATEVDRVANPTLERRIQLMSEQCLPRGQQPTDLVGLAMFLSSQASSFITGQTIACDGGFTHSS